MGVHKDSLLGFQYVDSNARRQNIATRLQTYIANQMIKNNRIPFFMVSLHNEVALNFQKEIRFNFCHKIILFLCQRPI